eukprot:COSAG04_NODE_20735_length_387_cov_1.197917_1_plen_54_part_10
MAPNITQGHASQRQSTRRLCHVSAADGPGRWLWLTLDEPRVNRRDIQMVDRSPA